MSYNIGGTDGELDRAGRTARATPWAASSTRTRSRRAMAIMGCISSAALEFVRVFPSLPFLPLSLPFALHVGKGMGGSFVGNNAFCGKICDQTGSQPQALCNNIYDRLGCEYNAPADVPANTFEYCLGDDMTSVGQYVGTDGKTSTYFQPSSETISIDYDHLPYTPTPAATSSCTPYASAAIFTDGVVGAGAAPTGASGSNSATGSATGSNTAKATGANTAKASGSQSGSSANPSATGKSGAVALSVSAGAVVAAFFGVLVL
ncbi:hypothetical protein C8R45DRAFT_1220405 [Mycena sanguinolenta]|nr:hypothetical protein C8R45DRAFT_1220405 [Mycena sanguinolenta]